MKYLKKSAAFLFVLCVCLSIGAGKALAGSLPDSKNLWLVNKSHSVLQSYEASDMRSVDGSSKLLRAEAATAFNAMRQDAATAGVGKIYACSGYRSYTKQQYLFSSRLRERQNSGMSAEAAYSATSLFTAPAGTSEHQTGLAVDITNGGELNSNYDKTKQGAWLKKNCWKYGFILRYDGAKTGITGIGDEPWHFRYVGVPHAQIIYENGWCLEEYIEQLKKCGVITYAASDGMMYDIHWSSDKDAYFPNAQAFSSDNCGGYITTCYYKKDPLANIGGSWAEPYFKKFFEGKDINFHKTVNPSHNITRAEFAVLCSLLPIEEKVGDISFFDVEASAWFKESLSKAVRMGLISGKSENSFAPNEYITREMAAVVIAKAIKCDKIEIISFNDIGGISPWAFQGVQKAVYNKIMSGYADNSFRAKGYISWAEAVASISKLNDLLKSTN